MDDRNEENERKTEDKRKTKNERKVEDDDRDALAGLSAVPPPRKSHSYSQQLRGSSGKKRLHQVRKHSLDDTQFNTSTTTNINKDNNNNNVLETMYDSSDDDFFPYSSTTASAATSGLDDQCICMDGMTSSDDSHPAQPLPEFIGNGGGTGIFKVPVRAAVHPARPPCLELRPHPLRETQVGRFLRNIACRKNQLWAGQENGLRYWNLQDAYEPGRGLGGRITRGDEDAAPFHESMSTPPVICMLLDDGNKLLWSGHKDGKIRSWKMDQPVDDNNNKNNTPFKEGLSWQAHRGPVLAMVMSSHGDMWSGSEGGIIKIWPWESIEKSVSLKPEEKYMAALLVERSGIDLRAQVTVNGACSISSQDVKCLLSDNARAKVWCAGFISFSLWDARTRELVKVFNVEGQIENRVDMSAVQQDQAAVEDEVKLKFASTSKKEKSGGFLQRSRNAIMGAADAVRRVATRSAGAFVEAAETKRIEALVQTADGMIWSGCTNGLLVQWDGNGNRLQDFNHHACAVQCFCTFGTRLYVGYVSGIVQVLDLEGNVIAAWIAHSSPVIKLAVGTKYVYSLATHGGIRGWNISSPGPMDSIIRSELAAKENIYTRRDNVRIFIGTWNVGQGRPSHESLMAWLGSAVSDVGIVVVGLQEVEMGAGFLAMSAAKETVGLEGSSAGNWWLDHIGKALDEGRTFERTGSRQLAGLLISLWVRKNLRKHVGDIDAGAVPCGLGRAIGNKGGVGLRIRVYDRIMCFVNCHLAAHLEAVNRRNADFDHIYRNMVFNRSSTLLTNAAAGVSTSSQMLRGSNDLSSGRTIGSAKESEGLYYFETANGGVNNSFDDTRPELAEADMVVFLGDFNYRLFGISYDEARDFVSQRCFDWLREKDQLRAEMKAGKVFQGMREALIRFPPTYKFQRNQPGLGGYDSGEKKRIPAWCDRIIYRDNRLGPEGECSLECPVVSSIIQYQACMDVIESDHKPVRCKFNLEIAHVDRSVRRKEVGEIFKSNEKIQSILQELSNVPETSVSTDYIKLQNQEASNLRITNKCTKDTAVFKVLCQGQSTVKEGKEPQYHPRGSLGFPRWLEVTPTVGVLKPEQSMEILVRHEENRTSEEFVEGVPQNWSEDTRDKEVLLLVKVQGSGTNHPYTHTIRMHHCFSAKTASLESKSSSSRSNKNNNNNSNSSKKNHSQSEQHLL